MDDIDISGGGGGGGCEAMKQKNVASQTYLALYHLEKSKIWALRIVEHEWQFK